MAISKYGAMASLVLGITSVNTDVIAQEKTALTTEREKVSYAMGMQMGSSFKMISKYLDVSAAKRATENVIAGKPDLLTKEQAMETDAALRKQLMVDQGQSIPGTAPGTQPAPVSKEKVGLMLGTFSIGPTLKNFKDEIDLPMVFQAINATINGKPFLIEETQAVDLVQQFMQKRMSVLAEKNKREGIEFLAKNKNENGVITTPSGLQYSVITEGKGARPLFDVNNPQASSSVRVHYEGRLLDGTVFDSSYQRGEPTSFGLGQVIKGWGEGLSKMPVGSKYRFWIPSELAYGANPQPGSPIAPNSTLIFDVELLGIQ